jgi:hypothetical protein
LLAGFLFLAPPAFVAGPLAGLLLLSGPRSFREWGWLVGAVALSAVWLQQPGGLGAQFTRAGAVLLCGTFLALTIWRPSGRFSHVLGATAAASVALAAWMRHLGVGWEQVRRAVEQDLAGYQRVLQTQWSSAGASRDLLDQLASVTDSVARLYPGLLALAGIAGLRLAWAWYHRIARRPLGSPLPPFSQFSFNDQLVWGWVIGLALVLVPLPAPAALLGQNLLLVWTALYTTRGLAVFTMAWARVPGAVILVLAIVAMFLLPFLVGGLTLLGLADTWLDFRRRLATPTAGGIES